MKLRALAVISLTILFIITGCAFKNVTAKTGSSTISCLKREEPRFCYAYDSDKTLTCEEKEEIIISYNYEKEIIVGSEKLLHQILSLEGDTFNEEYLKTYYDNGLKTYLDSLCLEEKNQGHKCQTIINGLEVYNKVDGNLKATLKGFNLNEKMSAEEIISSLTNAGYTCK